jgi:hypothetical protein
MTDAEMQAAIDAANVNYEPAVKNSEGQASELKRDERGQFAADKNWMTATPEEMRAKLLEYGVNR